MSSLDAFYQPRFASEWHQIHQPQLSRFVKGERDLLLDAADKVAKSLGLELRKIDD